MLTKRDLTILLSEKTGLPKTRVEAVINEMLVLFQHQLSKPLGAVQLRGLGTFRAYEVAARIGRNPRTGEEIKIPARVRVRFKPGSALTN